MAINPNIALAGQPLDLGATIQGALVNRGEARTQGVREQILNQQAQVGEVSAAQTQGAYMNQLATGLKGLPLDQRAAVVAQQMPLMTQMGFDPSQILSQDLSDTGLDQAITGTQMFVKPQGGQGSGTAAQQDFNFFQGIIDNPKSTPEEVHAAKIKQGTAATQGRGQLRETGVPGVFQVFDSNNMTLSDPMKRDDSGQLVPLTRKEQLEAGLSEQVEEITTTGEATTEVLAEREEELREGKLETQRQEAAVTLDAELKATDMRDLKVRRKAAIANGVVAKDSLANIGRMAEISERVITGGATAMTKAVTDWLGMTSADLGEFNRRSGELVLSTIRQLGANPTEGERAFLEMIQPSVGQSAEVNIAILKDLQRIAERQVDRAKRLVDDPDLDPNIMILNEPDFQPEFRGTQQVQTPAGPRELIVDPVTGEVDSKALVDSYFNTQ